MFRLLSVLFIGVASALSATPSVAASEDNERGLALAAHGEDREAVKLFRKSMEEWRELGPAYDAHRATAIANLAQSYCALGERRTGADLLEEALAIFRRTLGLHDDRTLNVLNLLAAVDLMLGESSRGEELLNEALPVEKEFFPKDLQMGRTLAGLASLNLNRGKPEAALPLIEEALKIAIASQGELSLDVALDYAVAAEVHRVAHRNDRAMPLFRKARYIYSKTLDPEHPRIASILAQEGLIQIQEGKFGLAEKSMKTALQILQKRCPGCVVEQSVVECNLGVLRFRQQRYAEADALLAHSLLLQERYVSQPGPYLAPTIQALARVREKERLFDDAARLHRRADLLLSLR